MVSLADVEESLAPSQPPADGAQALVPPQHPANAAQALVPPGNGQPTEAALLAAVPPPEPKKRNLRRAKPLEPESLPDTPAIEPQSLARARFLAKSQPIVIGNVPGTPVSQNSDQPEKKQPKNRKAKIGELLDSDDEKENGGANVPIIAKGGLLAGSK